MKTKEAGNEDEPPESRSSYLMNSVSLRKEMEEEEYAGL